MGYRSRSYQFFRLRSGLDGIVPLKLIFNAIDISDEWLLIEALNMSSKTFTSAEFFLQLPWRLFEKVRKACEEKKDGRRSEISV